MTLDERIAKERKAVARHQKAIHTSSSQLKGKLQLIGALESIKYDILELE